MTATAEHAFAKIVSTRKKLDRWEAARNDPRKFQPVMRCEYSRAFDAYQAAKDAAYKVDPTHFLSLFPDEQMARENA